ncbi:MAG: Mur ligase family protein [Pseudomonadota bacterium]|nr:Mur ligase family protein [Pseudomonadota bacterium]
MGLPEFATWLDTIQQFHSSEIELGLERLAQVAQRLSIKPNATVITIAGTNGKGSTAHAISQIAQAHGQRVGLYCSPHFLRFTERALINNQEQTEQQWIEAFERIDNARQEIPLTFFEFTTLAAFLLFEAQELDLWVLEVGLGGRLDAVNIIDSDVAIVTSIGLDHQDFLGETREAIGFEKVGIARCDKPLIIGAQDCPQSVLKQAQALTKHLHVIDRDFHLHRHLHLSGTGHAFNFANQQQNIEISLPPFFVPSNAAVAIQALYQWRSDWQVGVIQEVLGSLELKGRAQAVKHGSHSFLLDVGHNPQAVEAFMTHLDQSKCYSVIIGMLKDKDTLGVLQQLEPMIEHWSLVNLDAGRNAGVDVLRAQVLSIEPGAQIDQFDTVKQAIEHQLSQPVKPTPCLILGSFFTIAEGLAFFEGGGEAS